MISPRKKFIQNFLDLKNFETLLGYIYDTMQLASTHDPDHARAITHLYKLHDRNMKRIEAKKRQCRYQIAD